MSKLTAQNSWQKLISHQKELKTVRITNLFVKDAHRAEKFTAMAANLTLDYSKNPITEKTLDLLCELALEADLNTAIQKMFDGEKINNTENRAVLHTALRNPDAKPHIKIKGEDITLLVEKSLEHMQLCAEKIRSGKHFGVTGKSITNIVNIGIGGSDLGPAMVVKALTPYIQPNLHVEFVSNVDGTQIFEATKNLNPETTLFIVSSKTFTTEETLTNALTAKNWLKTHLNNFDEQTIIKKHFLAVTANPVQAIKFGIEEENIYVFWDFVGGRFSLWSAIGLSIVIAIGMENFYAMLKGAHECDEHFRHAPFRQNLPVLLALLGIWHINFSGTTTQAILPYDQSLSLLPPYLQQLEMESNGKSVAKDGSPVDYATAPVIWGAVGTNGQHAFHQLLMQGTQIVPVDFILPLQSHHPIGDHQLLLVANCLAQAKALMEGKNEKEVIAELEKSGMNQTDAAALAKHKVIPGNRPSNMILMEKLTPMTLGALIALYEHKVFVQGVIWNINSFDQWGVELGKKIARNIVPALRGEAKDLITLDQDTQELVKMFIKSR